jgi:predicted alpha/beta superfamily hydrolase
MFAAACLSFGAVIGAAAGQDRQDVVFQISYNQTSVGQSVFVVGDLPELGGNDVTRAIKLAPAPWPMWRVTISLPANTSYTYQFLRRNDGPNGALGSTAGTTAITTPTAATTAAITPTPATKTVIAHSTMAQPVIFWRAYGSSGAYQSRPMLPFAAGRASVPGETRWIMWDLDTSSTPPSTPGGLAPREIEFYIAGVSGSPRDPASGTYRTPLDVMLVQDGQVFSYIPAASVGGWARDYNASALPAINSTNMGGERRPYRVLLPRGYQQHTTQRYPVLYLHDGQNVFDQGPFGTWNADDTAGDLTRLGRMRETIMVGVDNGPNRISDYAAPDSNGTADRYVRFIRDELKPLIDSQYRTLTGPDDTATLGSSMGAQVALYMGWDYSATFRKVGAFSGAWSVYTSGFYNRVMAEPKRAIRIYLDSGDSGTSSDNYWPTFNLRDNLLTRTVAGGTYTLEGDLRHRIGIGHQHNEAAWAARLPDCLTFLLPPTDGEQPLMGLATGETFDVNGDGAADVEDLYVQVAQGERDINLDGVADAGDVGAMRAYVRRREAVMR